MQSCNMQGLWVDPIKIPSLLTAYKLSDMNMTDNLFFSEN